MTTINEDQDLLKIIKQAKRKKRLHNIAYPIISVFLLLLTLTFIGLNYFNLGPFTKNDIAGIPDNHLRFDSTDFAFNKLLFDSSSSYQFNYYGNRVELRLAHYQNGVKISDEPLGPIPEPESPKKKTNISGSLAYGIDTNAEDKASTLSLYTQFNLGSTKQQIALADYGIKETDLISYSYGVHEMNQRQSFYSKNSYKIKKDTPYDLLILRNDGITYLSKTREGRLKDVPNGLALYLIFK